MNEGETQGDVLSAAQRRAITALLTESEMQAAAAAAKVSRPTLYRWLRDEAFRAELKRAQGELYTDTLRLLAQYQARAVLVMAAIMDAEQSSDTAKLQAARAILDLGDRRIAQAELEERLSAIEAQLKEAGAL